MEHTSGFRPPNRDVTHARDAKRTKHDHASRAYQQHLMERFKAREAARKTEAERPHTEQSGDTEPPT